MRDNPGKNLKWLEQELLAAEERPQVAPKPGEITYEEPDDLLQRLDDHPLRGGLFPRVRRRLSAGYPQEA